MQEATSRIATGTKCRKLRLEPPPERSDPRYSVRSSPRSLNAVSSMFTGEYLAPGLQKRSEAWSREIWSMFTRFLPPQAHNCGIDGTWERNHLPLSETMHGVHDALTVTLRPLHLEVDTSPTTRRRGHCRSTHKRCCASDSRHHRHGANDGATCRDASALCASLTGKATEV